MINNKNCVVVSTFLDDNPISIKRRENMIKNCKQYNLPLFGIKGIRYKEWHEDNPIAVLSSYETTLRMLNAYKKLNIEYGIICQDDFFPKDNFLEELNITVERLPKDWEILHLCPGQYWGRLEYRDKKKIDDLIVGKFVPEKNILYKMPCSKDNRYFYDLYKHKKELIKEGITWLGGPVAFIIKRSKIDIFLEKYRMNKMIAPDDKKLFLIMDKNCYICKEPQLGYEEECGGGTCTNILKKENNIIVK
jgi:hypothetical protein